SALQVDKGKSKVPETSLSKRKETSSSSLSLEYTYNSNVSNETNSGRRILSPVWTKWARGEPQRLEAHLAFDCPNVNNEEDLSEERIYSINRSLLKAFTVCGIPFSAIENPFFIDLLQNLCPTYQPPSRVVLAGRLLDQKHSKIIIKHEAIFNELENLTI
ncbi:23866_t:CDS:2, partial [Dentiscutata erythropus]